MTPQEHFLQFAPRLFRHVGGWTFDRDPVGSWMWCNAGRVVYATPFWEGTDGIPVYECDEDGRELVNAVVPFALTGSLPADADAYLAAVLPYLR